MHGRAAHATNGRVTTGTGDSVGGTDADGFARDWQALRADGDIQFAPLAQPEAQPPPDWWLDFVDFLERLFAPVADFFSGAARLIGVSGQALMWGLLGLGAVLTVLILWRYLPHLRQRKTGDSEAAEWSPEAGEAAPSTSTINPSPAAAGRTCSRRPSTRQSSGLRNTASRKESCTGTRPAAANTTSPSSARMAAGSAASG